MLLRVLPVLLLMPVLALGQESPRKGPATLDPRADSTIPTEYSGCVIRSGGSLMLTDAQNRDYKLVSKLPSLDSYLGKEVKLKAVQIKPGDPSSDEYGRAASGPAPHTLDLDVQDIEVLAGTCSSPKSENVPKHRK